MNLRITLLAAGLALAAVAFSPTPEARASEPGVEPATKTVRTVYRRRRYRALAVRYYGWPTSPFFVKRTFDPCYGCTLLDRPYLYDLDDDYPVEALEGLPTHREVLAPYWRRTTYVRRAWRHRRVARVRAKG